MRSNKKIKKNSWILVCIFSFLISNNGYSQNNILSNTPLISNASNKLLNKNVPDWNFKLLPGDGPIRSNDPQALGDINGDGIDDFVVYYSGDQNSDFIYQSSKAYFYFGSQNGINDNPDVVITYSEDYPLLVSIKNIGDINNDGFNDIAIFGSSFEGGYNVHFGSTNGPATTPSVSLNISELSVQTTFYEPYAAGDVNGDGIDDFVVADLFGEFLYLFYGKINYNTADPDWSSQPIQYSESAGVTVAANDYNNDGFNDISFGVNDIFIFYGGTMGLSKENMDTIFMYEKIYTENKNDLNGIPDDGIFHNRITGDFNGDGFFDIIIRIYYDYFTDDYATNRIIGYLFKGTEQGINFNDFEVIENISSISPFYYLSYFNSLGDINNDGFDDFSMGNKIYYGSYDFKFPVSFEVEGFKYILKAGDLNNDSNMDYIGVNFNKIGLFYSTSSGSTSLTCIDSIAECFKGDKFHYTIPPLNYEGNFQSINFTVKFNNRKNRTGELDASGIFTDSSTIIWYGLAYNQLTYTCTTSFKFKYVPTTNVTIKEAYSVNPGGEPNTFYVGHGADWFRLNALPSGGGGPYEYLWSNGSTEKNPRVSERVPGEYPYWVQLTNKDGCTSSDTTIIKVENALCSSPLVDAVMQSYPMILQNTILNNLIKANSKVAVCKDGQTLCLARSVVATRLSRNGYSMGACEPGIIPATAFMTNEIEEILSGNIKVLVAPNPTTTRFQLNVVNIYNEPVNIRITDISGRQVEQINRAASNTTIYAGEKLRPGVYFAEVVSGTERTVIKLVKTE